MGRVALTLSALCAIFGAAVAAQTSPSPSPSRPAGQTQVVPEPLRLTGCVRTWDPSTMGPPPAAASGTGDPVPAGPTAPFVLVNAQPAGEATTPAPTGTSGRSPAIGNRPGRGGHATYLLKPGTPAVDLAGHVDQQVEITGILAPDESAALPAARRSAPPPRPPTPPPAAQPSPPPPPPGADAREPAPPVALTVTAIKTIEKACVRK